LGVGNRKLDPILLSAQVRPEITHSDNRRLNPVSQGGKVGRRQDTNGVAVNRVQGGVDVIKNVIFLNTRRGGHRGVLVIAVDSNIFKPTGRESVTGRRAQLECGGIPVVVHDNRCANRRSIPEFRSRRAIIISTKDLNLNAKFIEVI